MAHYPLVRAPKPALIWPAACVLLFWAVSYIPVLFLTVCFFTPVILAVCGARAGLVPMAACGMLAVAACYLLFGQAAAALVMALYLLPFLALNAFCFLRKIPFWQAAAAHAVLLAAVQTAILMVFRQMVGGDLFIGGADYLVDQVAASPYGDLILIQLYQSRLLNVPEELVTGPKALLEAFYASLTTSLLTASVRTELLNGLRTLLQSALYALLPSTVIKNAILAGVFGMAFPILALRKKAVILMEMPPFSTWHLSRRAGMQMLVLGLGGMLPYVASSQGIMLAGNMMGAAFSTVFAIQGAALLDFVQKKNGTRRFWRRVWPCLIYLMVPTLLMIMGIADQFMNIRGVRVPKDKEES